MLKGEVIRLEEAQHHYLNNVMRLKQGNKIIAFNGINGDWSANIISSSKRETDICLQEQVAKQKTEKKLTLFFAPVKIVTAAWIAQKATELGVTSIYPVITERTIVSKVNIDKLTAAVIEAAEQCERQAIPKVYPEISLKKLVQNKNFSGKLIFCDERMDPTNTLEKISHHLPAEDNAIIIGPEGGFSDKEKEFICNEKYVLPISLGGRILRAETAMIAALSIYQSIMDAKG
jgi:16S rRNA (uracil1498-N3)-methyltransferase